MSSDEPDAEAVQVLPVQQGLLLLRHRPAVRLQRHPIHGRRHRLSVRRRQMQRRSPELHHPTPVHDHGNRDRAAEAAADYHRQDSRGRRDYRRTAEDGCSAKRRRFYPARDHVAVYYGFLFVCLRVGVVGQFSGVAKWGRGRGG